MTALGTATYEDHCQSLSYDKLFWEKGAACADVCSEGYETFFSSNLDDQIEVAEEYCSECPVKIQCLEYALSLNIIDGVWGGAPELFRNQISKKLRNNFGILQYNWRPSLSRILHNVSKSFFEE